MLRTFDMNIKKKKKKIRNFPKKNIFFFGLKFFQKFKKYNNAQNPIPEFFRLLLLPKH